MESPDRLRILATAFHDALIQSDIPVTNLQNFPRECCNHACNLLGMFLIENGVTNISRVYGGRPDKISGYGGHVWLEVADYTIDITAYQFEGVKEKVIVSTHSQWHAALNGRKQDFRIREETWGECLQRLKNGFRNISDLGPRFYDDLAQHALDLAGIE